MATLEARLAATEPEMTWMHYQYEWAFPFLNLLR